MSLSASCGSLITSSGPRTAPNVTLRPLNTSCQCAIGCAPKTSSRMAVSCDMFAISFAGSEKRGSVRRSVRPMALATAATLSGVMMRTNQVSSEARYTFNAAFAGFLRSCGAANFAPAKRALDRNARRPDALGEQRGRDVRPLAGALATIECRDDGGIQPDGRRIVTAAAHRPGRRHAGIARHRQQAAACPVRRDVEARQIGVRPLFAEAREVRIDQARVPLRDIFVFELQFLARGVRRVDDEYVGPLDELLQAPAARSAISDRASCCACCGW